MPEDVAYVYETGFTADNFDRLHLKKQMVEAVKAKKATILKQSCSHGTILVVKMNEGPGSTWSPPWSVWWRAVRLLSQKPVRILIFGHPRPREFPEKGSPVVEENINGG